MRLEVIDAIEAGCQSGLMAFGHRAQTIKTCEEMGELTTVLCKSLNGSPVTMAQIVDEVADVIIMAFSMRNAFGEDAVDERIRYKLDRTMAAIRKRNAPETMTAEVIHPAEITDIDDGKPPIW